jgi:hypothetical protein
LSDRPNWYGRVDSNHQVSRFVAEYPFQLNDARVKTWQGGVNSNHRYQSQSLESWPLNDRPMVGRLGLEPR